MFSDVLQMISTIIPVSPDLQSTLLENLIIDSFPKKTKLLKQGEVSNYMYFILKGMIRAYYYDGDREVTRIFLGENDIAISMMSFYKRVPTVEFLETLEPCELAYIHYNDLQTLYREFTEFNIVGRILTEHYYCRSEECQMTLRLLSGKARYESMLLNDAELLHRVPVKYLAPYLCMSIENISRIRARIK